MNKEEIKNKIEELEKQLVGLKEELKESETKVFKPRIGDIYYCVNCNGVVLQYNWDDDELDNMRYAIGNCFRTKEEEEFQIEKLKVIAELKRFAEENNDIIDWNDHIQPKFCIRYDFIQNKIITNFDTAIINNCIYFSSIGIARQAVKQIGEDRIKKYYFGVED